MPIVVKCLVHVLVALLLAGLVLLYTYPLVLAPGSLLPEHHDPRLFGWVMMKLYENLTTRPGLLFHGNAFYPFGNTLSYTEPLLTPALVAGPVLALSGNPVLAYNATLVVMWALSGWVMYAVALWVTGRHAAAIVAALVFTLSPYRTDYHLEFQMQVAFGIPLAVYLLVRFLEGGRVRHLVALLVVFWLQAVAVWYYAVILAFGLAAVAVQVLLLRWRAWTPGRLVGGGVGAAALGAALAPVAWPFFLTRRELGFERGLADALDHSADLTTYVATGFTRLYRFAPPGDRAETALFLGFAALALVLVALAWLRRPAAARPGWLERSLATGVVLALAAAVLAAATRGRIHVGPLRATLGFSAAAVTLLGLALARHAAEGWRRWRTSAEDTRLGPREWVAILLVLALVAGLLSLGPTVRFKGDTLGPGLYAWLYPWLLPLHAVRVATRFGVLVVFAGALLAGLGVAWLARRLSPRAFAWVVASASLVLLAEYATFPIAYARHPVARPVDHILREAPGDVAVLEWPTNVTYTDTDVMFRSLVHGKRVVNGFSGFVPGFIRQLSALLTAPGPPFPAPEAETALRRIYPLRYLVIRRADPAARGAWEPVWDALRADPPPLLAFRGRFGSEDLYELRPLPEHGDRLERWVAYDLLLARPVLHVAVRPRARLEGREQWVEVLLNGRVLRRLPLTGPVEATVHLPPPDRRVAPSVVALRSGYGLAAAVQDQRYRIGTTGALSPADLRVASAGQPYGRHASIRLNGLEVAPGTRGYNLAAIDPVGRLLRVAAFDTFLRPEAVREMVAWIEALPSGTIVAGAVKDEGSGQLTVAAIRALASLGVAGDLRGRFRESHAFVGVRGAPPGSALEALGPHAVEVVVGEPSFADRPATFELTAFDLLPAGASAPGRP